MPTDPATTSQVQAYRFVLRRMESALIRKDAVMLHEPQRHHLRATAVGVVLAVLGLVAAMIFGGSGPTSNLSAATGLPAVPPASTVLVQERPPAAPALSDDQALLVTEQNTGVTYLVRREGHARIDLRDLAIRNY
jgi:hypothetical protein